MGNAICSNCEMRKLGNWLSNLSQVKGWRGQPSPGGHSGARGLGTGWAAYSPPVAQEPLDACQFEPFIAAVHT